MPHILYHLMRADFYERVRRYSFLVMLGSMLFIGYQSAIGNLTLSLGKYRGEFNSAWLGAMMASIATFFLGWFGFYLIKGAVARDRETGVGQIIATTPLTRLLYLAGKWLSNLAVLVTLAGVLALVGLALQLWVGENRQLDLLVYLAPFVFIVMPLLALVAALAVLFEVIPFLRGSVGNIIYFFAFVLSVPLFIENDALRKYVALEPMGINLLAQEMGQAARAIYPDFVDDFTLGQAEPDLKVFTWNGIRWTPEIVLARGALLGLALGLVLLAALLFDRFDTTATRPRATKPKAPEPTVVTPTRAPTPNAAPHLTPLASTAQRYSFINVLWGELKLLLKGQRWWWYAIAVGLVLLSFFNDAATTHAILLPLAWVWPTLIWSALGNREKYHNVQQITYSSAAPVWRQLPAQWLAGLVVTVVMASGAILRLGIANDWLGLGAVLAGALFIPSLALAAGVWSGSSKLFEVLYITLWYLGPLNNIPALDYMGATHANNPLFFALLAGGLLAGALWGRTRQLQT